MGIPELPSAGFYDRLTTAMQAWEKRHGMVGQRGGQAQLLTKMRQRFGDEAPTQGAVSQWFRQETTPGPDGGAMLAYALDVRPEWLVLNSGPMRSKDEKEPHNGGSKYRATPDDANEPLSGRHSAQKKRRGSG